MAALGAHAGGRHTALFFLLQKLAAGVGRGREPDQASRHSPELRFSTAAPGGDPRAPRRMQLSPPSVKRAHREALPITAHAERAAGTCRPTCAEGRQRQHVGLWSVAKVCALGWIGSARSNHWCAWPSLGLRTAPTPTPHGHGLTSQWAQGRSHRRFRCNNRKAGKAFAS